MSDPSRTVGSVRLHPDFERALTFQSYARGASIAGIHTRPLAKHRGENGWFAELLRLESDGTSALGEGGSMAVRQISVSHARPGRINAFHIHPKLAQNELWTVVSGQLLVWLVDGRADSPTVGTRQRVVLSGEQPVWLYIPAGVAHGYRSGDEGAVLIYAMDQQFNADDPNEGRLSWDHFGAEIWDEDRG